MLTPTESTTLPQLRHSQRLLCCCSILTADKERLHAQLGDVETLRIEPLYKSIDSLTADVAAKSEGLATLQTSITALQADIAQLETKLEAKRGKKRAYKTAFVGKVCSLNQSTCIDSMYHIMAANNKGLQDRLCWYGLQSQSMSIRFATSEGSAQGCMLA